MDLIIISSSSPSEDSHFSQLPPLSFSVGERREERGGFWVRASESEVRSKGLKSIVLLPLSLVDGTSGDLNNAKNQMKKIIKRRRI
jgi:hypothetical protein